MWSATRYSRVVVRGAALALLVSCSYDLDRFGRTGAGGAITTGGSDDTATGAAGASSGSGGGSTGGSTGSSTGGATSGTTGGSAGDSSGGAGSSGGTGGTSGGGSAGAVGVGGGAGSAGASGNFDAGSDADSAPNDGGSTVDQKDARDAADEARSTADASTDGRAVDACSSDACGACTSTAECSCSSYNGHVYRFCTTARSFSDSQLQCASASMRLARVDDLSENAWIRATADTLAMAESWIGIQDPNKTLNWQWTDGTAFWSGGPTGTPVGGLFNAWSSGHPTGGVRNCASMLPSASSAQWFDRSCTSLLPYVCELY